MKLTTVLGAHGHTRELKDGTITPQRATLEFEEVPVLVDAFRRMVRGLDYDVSEMSFAAYLSARAHGRPFTALPVFLVRGFQHGSIVASTANGARRPEDLEGRKVGVYRGYTVTSGVWARGILQQEFGVDPSRVTWVLTADEHVPEHRLPANVVPPEEGADVAGMVATGQLAAGIRVGADRPGVAPLIPGGAEAGFEALRQRGFYPINHLVVVRDELLARYPDLAEDLFWAFAEAKKHYVGRLADGQAVDEAEPADKLYRRVMDITGGDPLPYGIAPNRPMIDQLIGHAVSQHIIERPLTAEDLFPASTHHLSA